MQKTLNDLFLEQLKDIYFAEKQIYRILPKMAKAAKISQLKEAFTAHREQTQEHIARLEEVFETLGKRPQAKTCEAIKGIISEGEETIDDFGESEVLDAGLVAAGQAVEHYEMDRYGAADCVGEANEHDRRGGPFKRNPARRNQGRSAADPNRGHQRQ
jgi:ferritin-like metal-binding protein YciE